MAITKIIPKDTSKPYRRQALIWLATAIGLAVLTAILWMLSQSTSMSQEIENNPLAPEQVLSEEMVQPKQIESLHELDSDVQPIDFKEVVHDLRDYPEEFKDKRYLVANKGKWTVQVMNVAEHEVITDYLNGRNDREKFAYFRYRDSEDNVRYMLTYGIMNSPQEALGTGRLVDFGLPNNVRVLPEEIDRYVSIIDNYERAEPIKDLATPRTRSVNLQPTQREVPVKAQDNASAQEADSDADTNNTASDANEGSSTNAARDTNAQTSAESIRTSRDSSDTLVVDEQRAVTNDADAVPAENSNRNAANNNSNSSNNAARNNNPQNNASQNSAAQNNNQSSSRTPAVPSSERQRNAETTNNSSSNGASSNNNANSEASDPIRDLIEDRTP